MIVDIQVIEKPEISSKVIFETKNFTKEKDFKEALAIIFMVCGDYYLDPELEVEDLQGFLEKASEKKKDKLALYISEDGLELDFEE